MMRWIPQTWLGRISLLFSGLLIISATIKLPLPIRLANTLLEGQSEHLQVSAERAWVRWGRGEIGVEGLKLLHQGEERASVATLHTFLDLWPGSDAFGRPVFLEVDTPVGILDQELLDDLSKLRSKDASPFPLRMLIKDADVRWRQGVGEEEQIIHLDGLQIQASLSPDGAMANVDGTFRSPAIGAIGLRATAGEGMLDWQLDGHWDLALDTSLKQLEDLPLALEGVRLQGKAWGSFAQDQPASLQLDTALAMSDLAWVGHHLEARDLNIRAVGDLFRGLQVSLEGQHEHLPFQAQAEIQEPLGAYRVEVRSQVREVMANRELVSTLNQILPFLEEILLALEPRGAVDGDFVLTAGAEQDLDWGLRLGGEELQVTWRGILDDEGNRFSFPYPLRRAMGNVWICGDALTFLGSAELAEQGMAHAEGSFDFRPESEQIVVELETTDVALDRRLPNALAGNPDLADLVRNLGSPEGGSVDVGVKLHYFDEELLAQVKGEARDFVATPAFLPLKMSADYAWFQWQPGLAEFGGMLRAMQGDINLFGRVVGNDAADIRVEVQMRGKDFAPSEAELKTLEGFLPLPDGLSRFSLSGSVQLDLAMKLWPEAPERTQLQVQASCDAAKVHWQDLQVDFTPFHGLASFTAVQEDFLLSLPRAWTKVEDGAVLGSLVATSFPEASSAVIEAKGLAVTSQRVLDLQRLTGQEVWGSHLNWAGAVDLAAELNPEKLEDFDASLAFQPLLLTPVEVPDATPLRIEGRIDGHPGRFAADDLRFESDSLSLSFRDLRATLDGQDLHADARLAKGTSLALNAEVAALIGPEERAAFEAIGLRGRLLAEDVQVHADYSTDGSLSLSALGKLRTEGIGMAGPLDVTEGESQLVIEEATLKDKKLHATVRMESGSGLLGGMQLEETSAYIVLTPEQVQVSDFQANLLGGRIHSQGLDVEGNPSPGQMTLGLTPQAPVSLQCYLDGLQLERMREELGLGGSLAGLVHGDLRFSSPTPSPTFARGRGHLHISDGALGTVPVLKTMWRIAGIDPPVFQSGDLDFRLNGEGRMYVDKLELVSQLLDVQGQGSIDLDSSLNLKVTIRTLSLLGRLPLVKDLLDWLIEQQVYGPIEAPVIRQRSLRKLAGQTFVRPPFPLWVPEAPQPNWRRSPIVPLDASVE